MTLSFVTYLFWLSLNNDFIHIVFLADFDKVHNFSVDDRFSVEFNNIVNLVHLNPGASRDS